MAKAGEVNSLVTESGMGRNLLTKSAELVFLKFDYLKDHSFERNIPPLTSPENLQALTKRTVSADRLNSRHIC